MIYGVCKYKNIMGITCYMNSILHILQQLPYFTIFIYDMMFEKNLKKKFEIYTLNLKANRIWRVSYYS